MQQRPAETDDCPLAVATSPASAAGAAGLPLEAPGAADAPGSAPGGSGMGGEGQRLEDRWWAGLGRPNDSARKKTAAEQEEEQLQQVLEMSRLEHEQQHQQQQQQQAGALVGAAEGTAGGGLGEPGEGSAVALSGAAAARAREEADLQEAIKQSMLAQGGQGPAQPAQAGSAAAATASPPAVAASTGAGQGQQPADNDCQSMLDILGEVMPGQVASPAAGTAGSAAEHAQQQQGCTSGAAEPDTAARAEDEVTEPMNGEGEAHVDGTEVAGGGGNPATAGQVVPSGLSLHTAAPAYLQAQVVEDDDSLLAETEAENCAARDTGLKPAGVAAHAAAAAAAATGAEAGPRPTAAQYRLHAVVNHRGPAATCGHFTSDICDPSGHERRECKERLVHGTACAKAGPCKAQPVQAVWGCWLGPFNGTGPDCALWQLIGMHLAECSC